MPLVFTELCLYTHDVAFIQAEKSSKDFEYCWRGAYKDGSRAVYSLKE